MQIKTALSCFHSNYFGNRINKKIIIIESDDWGSTRMPSKGVYDKLELAGIPVGNSIYCKFDSLENDEDVTNLLDVLSSVKNRDGKNPILTANFVVANPDFKNIIKNSFSHYYYESIIHTYKNFLGHEKVLDYIQQGINSNLIKPQFHGRDHVNVPLWLNLLQVNNDFRLAFDFEFWGLSKDVFPLMRKSIQSTYDSEDYNYCNNSISEGLRLFKEIFGFFSKSFIANNYIWPLEIEKSLYDGGVRHFQGIKYQLLPMNDLNYRKKNRIYFGLTNNLGMSYGIRNCSFEPTLLGDDVSKVLFQINNAFFLKKPAIISSHRINFSGGMCKSKRDSNLKKFKTLLREIVKKWPDVNFYSSDQIYDIITRGE